MSDSLLSDGREDYIFGSLVKGATKLVKSAALKNSKEYKDVVKELTTDNSQGAGIVYSKKELKDFEKEGGADNLNATFEMFNEFLMHKNQWDSYANELIDAGVKPSSVKRILSREFKDEDLTEGERSIRVKVRDKYFRKNPETGAFMDIDYKKPILIEHQEGREPKMGGSMISRQNYGGGSLMAPPERQLYVFGSLAKIGSKAARSILVDATKEVKKAQKNLPDVGEQQVITKELHDSVGKPPHGPFRDPDYEKMQESQIENSELFFSGEETLDKSIKQLKNSIYNKIDDKVVANQVYLEKLGELENNIRSKPAYRQMEADLEEGASRAEELAYKDSSFSDDELKAILEDLETFSFSMDEEVGKIGFTRNNLDRMAKRGKLTEQLLKEKFNYTDAQLNDMQENTDNVIDYYDDLSGKLVIEASKKLGIIEDSPFNTGGRVNYQEGGSLMVPPEMEQDMPVDTYPNIPPDEMAEAEASQLPDEEMEVKHMGFVLEQSLDEEEQSYLSNALEADPRLSDIFNKVVVTASEFTGSGEVEGPGTGVSDSIPARLSDGEFVFTKKATDQMGADNLQTMMDDAERAYDGGAIRMPKEGGGMMMYRQRDEDPLAYEKVAQDEIKKSMLRANRAPSLLG